MIVDERIVSYINSLDKDLDGVLGDIEKEAYRDGVPIIRRDTRKWLKTMMMIKKPAKILEVGTAIGFSSIYMCQYMADKGHITTIENWRPRITQANNNFLRAGVSDRITLIEGDAAEVLNKLDGMYDFVFMDAAKGQYINFLPDVLRLTNEGGVIISDNVLQDGDIVDSRFVVDRRNRTIHSRMREYLYEISHNDVLDTSVIPVGDGIALSVKLK